MSKYYKADDVIRGIAGYLAWHDNRTNRGKFDCIDGWEEWIENAEEFVYNLPTIEVSEDAISREWAINKQKEIIDLYTPHKTVEGRGQVYWQIEERELVAKELEQAPSVIPTNENEIKLCRNCDNAYLYQDCLYCDEIEEETEIEPDDACSLWKLRESSVKPKEGEWIYTSDRSGYIGNPVEKCSICGVEYEQAPFNYCPNCGSKMKGAE